MGNAFKKFVNTIPKVFNPETNRVIYALLYAIAKSDDSVEVQIGEAKKDLFVRTATGDGLVKLASSLGVAKPASLGLTDADFQELIPNLSLKPKNIRKAFYDTADVFWGKFFSRANVTASNTQPYNVNVGDVLKIRIGQNATKEIKILTGEIAVPGAATVAELKTIFENKIPGLIVNAQEDSVSGDVFLNFMTSTPGPTGSIQIFDCTMIGSGKINIPVKTYDILSLDQRVSIYNINPNELLIEIPAIVPALRRTLKGSHHFHEDSTLEPPVAPANGIWAGSFLFNPNGSVSTNTISRQKCAIQQTIQRGQIYTSISVDDNSSFLQPSGELVFGFGTTDQEGPIKYRGVPNSNTILLDPSYTFKKDHAVNTILNVITKKEPYVPVRTGKDLAIYLTSPSGAREIVQEILEGLAAAGIIVKFIILAPKYKYIIDNPYISEDDAPSAE